jgi:hypothetical protein
LVSSLVPSRNMHTVCVTRLSPPCFTLELALDKQDGVDKLIRLHQIYH